MLKKWIYACLGTGGSSTALRTAVVAPQLPVLPKRKQYNKKQINNTTTTDARHTHDDMTI